MTISRSMFIVRSFYHVRSFLITLSALSYQDEEPVDEHDDFCAVCGDHGDLLCCDICSRAFHINCVYPPIRKVPKGDWSCQVCTGADSDLPKARRVATIERERGSFDLRNKLSTGSADMCVGLS